MYFGPSNQNAYLPYAGGQKVTYETRADFQRADPLLNSSYFSSLIDGSYAIQSSDQVDSGQVTHLDVLTENLMHESNGDPLERFFRGKKVFLAKSVEDILGLIYEREYLRDENIRKIDYESSKSRIKLFGLDQWPSGIGFNPDIDKLRLNIEQDLTALEKEKRMEEIICWRDVCRLKTDLRQVMGEVSQEKRREGLISGKR